MNPGICGFYGFRVGFPQYGRSIFINKCEMVTDSYGKIIGLTNRDKLLWADVPSSDGEIQITGIGDGAFEGAVKLRKIKFSDSLEEVGENAFKGCSLLSSVTLPDTVYDIKSGAFEKSGVGFFAFPPLIEFVPPRCFMDAKALESVVFRGRVRKIGILSFAGCSALSTIELGENILEIDNGAFMSSSLISLHLPRSIKRIGSSAFQNSRRLESIYYDGRAEDFRNISFGENWNKGINKDCALFLKDKEGGWYNAFEKKEERRDYEELRKALSVFNMTELPTKNELNRIFHEKAKAFHPDRLAGMALDKEFTRFAEEKFRFYKEAYDVISRYTK